MVFRTTVFDSTPSSRPLSGAWLQIVYDASLLAEATRPHLVALDGAGMETRWLIPAPIQGRALWIGRIPAGVAALYLESTTGLRLHAVRRLGLGWRLSNAALRNPRHAAAALALAMMGHTERARRRLARGLMDAAPENYRSWAARRRRPHEPDGIDALPEAARAIREMIDVDLRAGEALTPWALDMAASIFAADPAAIALRGDAERADGHAGFASAWTPALGPLFRRRGTQGPSFRQVRTTLTRGAPADIAEPARPELPRSWPSVTAIVPTRDRLDLLRPCLEGILGRTDYPSLAVIVADNDSQDPATRAYLDALPARDPRARVLPCPGPFNFSAICNRAAREAGSTQLIFLNNDIEVVKSDWLQQLVALAMRVDAGAVGATLIYPNGRIQHAGVAMGPGGTAGHILRDKPLSALAAIKGPRAVSAVTGACLAVAREKFEAANGFDEAFPVTYNDIDLCLRLKERGWGALWSPETVLVHHESASRGAGPTGESSAQLLRSRWLAVIEDDPCFHPAFSDSALDLALG